MNRYHATVLVWAGNPKSEQALSYEVRSDGLLPVIRSPPIA